MMEEVVTTREWILFGAGDEGKKLAAAIESSEVTLYGFADNDRKKVGTDVCGKKVMSFADLVKRQEEYQIVISVSERYEGELAKQLEQAGVRKYLFLKEAYEQIKFKSNPALQKYRNRYQGKRCFIIGTGPSLKVEDLEALGRQGEITIASNKIFKLFDQTDWRPDIYCAIDNLVLQQYGETIARLPIPTILLADIWSEEEKRLKENAYANVETFRLVYKPFEGEALPEFSAAPDRYVIEGFTVTYAIMQWAAYMGFTEMYLLGIDFDYGNKETGYKHFMSGYDGENEKVRDPRLDKCLKAYEMAEQYSRRNGFRIFNATRGGKLEVFERADIDKIIQEEL